MTKYIPSLIAAFILAATTPAHATLIVYGVVNGVVRGVTGLVGGTTVGMPVSGYFSFDYDLLSPPYANGLRDVSRYDKHAVFSILLINGDVLGGGNTEWGGEPVSWRGCKWIAV